MRLHRGRVPQRAVDHELDRPGRVVDQRQQTYRSGRNPEVFCEPLGRREAEAAGVERRSERVQVDRQIVPDRHEEVPSALLVTQEQVLRLRAGKLRHEPLRFLDGHHRRV